MKRIARFEKVSFRQFSDGWDDTFQAIEKGENKDQSKETLKEIYEKTVQIKAGEGFMQGIFVEYGITVDDAATDVRNGGFGSTTK